MWETLLRGLGQLFSSGSAGGEVAARGLNEGGSLMQSAVPAAQQQPSMASQMGMAPMSNPMQSMDANPNASIGTQSLMSPSTGGAPGSSQSGKRYQNDEVDEFVKKGMLAARQPTQLNLYSLMNMMGRMK